MWNNEDLEQALDVLKKGGIILYPTDTIWGLGCDATQEDAVERLFRLKQRNEAKSMLVLLDTTAKLDYYVSLVQDLALDLIEYSTKPLTLIYPGARNIASNLIAQDGSIGIRITTESFTKELCKRLKAPLVSTSANISAEPSPRFFDEISDKVIQSVDYVVQYRREDRQSQQPSSIIKLDQGGVIQVIRE